MLTGLAALENTDWSRISHAYGPATDAPAKLRAFLYGDADAREASMQYLWGSILHQGTPCHATPLVALVIVGFLADERIDEVPSTRVHLIEFLASVAQVIVGVEYWDLKDLNAWAAKVEAVDLMTDDGTMLGCVKIAPILLEEMLTSLGHPDSMVRSYGAMGASALAQTPTLHSKRQDLTDRLLAMALVAGDVDERACLVLALGDIGYAPTHFLTDPSPAVRVCAALARSLAADVDAQRELLTVLEQHATSIDGWYEAVPQFSRKPRFVVVDWLVQVIHDFDRLVDAALAVVEVSDRFSGELGLLLRRAFFTREGIVKTKAQARFLEALVNREEFWDRKSVDAQRAFQVVRLPYDREACFQILCDSGLA